MKGLILELPGCLTKEHKHVANLRLQKFFYQEASEIEKLSSEFCDENGMIQEFYTQPRNSRKKKETHSAMPENITPLCSHLKI